MSWPFWVGLAAWVAWPCLMLIVTKGQWTGWPWWLLGTLVGAVAGWIVGQVMG